MKVIRAGVFTWTPSGDIATANWEFDLEGAPPHPADVLACMLNHIARASGLNVSSPADPIAAQGLAEDAIARARKAGL